MRFERSLLALIVCKSPVCWVAVSLRRWSINRTTSPRVKSRYPINILEDPENAPRWLLNVRRLTYYLVLVPCFTNAHVGLAFLKLLPTVLLFSLCYLHGHNPVNPRAFVSRGRTSGLPLLTPMRSFMRLQRQIATFFVRVLPPCCSRRFFRSFRSMFRLYLSSEIISHPCPSNSIPQREYAKDWWKMFAHVWLCSRWFDKCFRLMIIRKGLELFLLIFHIIRFILF